MSQPLTKQGAQWLLEALTECDLIAVPCFVCKRMLRDHTAEQIRECLDKVLPSEY